VRGAELVAGLKERGVLASALGRDTVRLVTHLDVDRAACVRASEVITEVMEN
jgi:threonine aldolase